MNLAAQQNTASLLDRITPQWHFREIHRIVVDADAPLAVAAAAAVSWPELALLPPGNRTILQTMTGGRGGFAMLDGSDEEIVIGAITKMGFGANAELPADGIGDFVREFNQPGYLKLTFNFRYAGGELTTQTRVQATSARARRLFRIYWTIIRLPSGLTRRRWLHAARRRIANSRPPPDRSA